MQYSNIARELFSNFFYKGLNLTVFTHVIEGFIIHARLNFIQSLCNESFFSNLRNYDTCIKIKSCFFMQTRNYLYSTSFTTMIYIQASNTNYRNKRLRTAIGNCIKYTLFNVCLKLDKTYLLRMSSR